VVPLPAGQLPDGHSFAISLDGTLLAFAILDDGVSRLYLRPLNEPGSTLVAGTEDAEGPFFSPDGRWIGFVANGLFKKVSVEGGEPLTVSEAPAPLLGASWGPDDMIVFSGLGSGLLRVSAEGGVAESLTTLDPASGESGHAWPRHLPGDDRVLFTSSLAEGRRRLGIVSPGTGEVTWARGLPTTVIEGQYLPTGQLLYAVEGGSLWAAEFDVRAMEVIGPPAPATDRVTTSSRFGQPGAPFSLSGTGTLIYRQSDAFRPVTLVAVDRAGGEVPILDLATAATFMLSPDGTQLAVNLDDGVERHLGLVSAGGGPVTSFTFDEDSTDPVWTPDGERIAFASRRDGPANLYWKPVLGGGDAEPLLIRPGAQYPHSFSPDGRYLAFYEVTPTRGRDIWVLTVDGSEDPRPLVQTPANERMPSISPTGRWFAYVSNENGTDEIYVERFPNGGAKQRVTTDGGRDPTWTRNGGELFFATRGEVWSAEVVYGADSTIAFETAQPVLTGLGDALALTSDSGSRALDVSADGQRFFLARGRGPQVRSQLVLVQNFFEELKRRVPN